MDDVDYVFDVLDALEAVEWIHDRAPVRRRDRHDPFELYDLNWKLKKFSWAETMVSFAGFDEFAGFVFLRTICWFRRNRARFGNAEFYAAMAFHETLLKSRVSSPKPWFRCLDNNFLWNYVHYDLN